MADIEKIVDNLNLPKQILDKSEALLKGLFGQSFEEIGGMIADQVRLRRFKNQITIFTKAQKILKEKNIDPKRVSLKVLAPLIEYSSYEEDKCIQDKWSFLTAYILENNSDITFQQNCIVILNKMSSEEAMFLDNLFIRFVEKRNARHSRDIEAYGECKLKPPKELKQYPLDDFTFTLSESRKLSQKAELSISNLVALGLLKWETEVQVDATKSSLNPQDDNIDVDVTVVNNYYFIFTQLGVKFVEICKSSK